MTNRILSPLHFEDMEPHRFEDLVRNLLYDFRDWQSIEATGRGGGDDGFDVRAWEKAEFITNQDENPGNDNTDNDNTEGIHPMEGNLWMIQCKREKQLGPGRVEEIINENVFSAQPPYGYILVAPTNFSKKSYDAFRSELRARGVMEFYLWGKAELEDMLFLPKNDRILFAFMGISLVSKRRSISSEVKFSINNKNKLLRILNSGENSQNFHQSILLRDIYDEHYPIEKGYEDFAVRPRWRECIAWGFDPRGLLVHVHEYFGYINSKKNTVDFVEAVDLLNREADAQNDDHEERQQQFELRKKIEDYWEHLPIQNQIRLSVDALIPYNNMLIIDDKGDMYSNFPHIFIDCSISGDLLENCRVLYFRSAGKNREREYLGRELKRVQVFPAQFPEVVKGHYHHDKAMAWNAETSRLFSRSWEAFTLFVTNGEYDYLNVRDRIRVGKPTQEKEETYIRITHKYKTTVAKYLKDNGEGSRYSIESQLGRQVKNSEVLTVFEIRRCYEWDLK
jgi:Restriction endonuclease